MKSQPTGRVITGLAGLALIVSLFFTWYSIEIGSGAAGITAGIDFDVSASGWESLEIGDLFLFLVGTVALAAAVMDYLGKQVELPIDRGMLFKVLGGLSLAYVILRILDKPDTGPDVPGVSVDSDLGVGIFIALIGAALLLFSALKYDGGVSDGGQASSATASTPAAATAPPIQPPAGTGEQAQPGSSSPDPTQPPAQH